MFLPIGDENPRERTPYVNYALLAVNIAVFFLFCFPEPREETVLARYALKPSNLHWPTLFSSMFLHAGFMHLAGNMLFLWIFGDNVEDRLGHVGYLIFYLAAGLAASFAHIATTATPQVYTLGASGAISGVVGAYAVFFPRHRVKMLVWIFIYVNVIPIPAFWWIGIWFLQQVFFAARGVGNVAYLAHIGGFAAGVAVAAAARLLRSGLPSSPRLPEEIREASRAPRSRRPFITIVNEEGVEFLDDAADRYSVVLLADDLGQAGRIAQAASEVTGEDPGRAARRLEATRGLVVREAPRVAAEQVQRALRARGVPSAIVHRSRANLPPPRTAASAVVWDDVFLRFTAENGVSPVLWTAPFLYLAARAGGETFIDVFASRRSAFRVTEGSRFAWIDVARRREREAGLDDLARAVLQYRSGAALNEGVHVLAKRGQWGWLSFRDPADYEDYAFWVYTLILSRVPLHRP
jgi:membrane associated rhomboid family serine protease